MKIIDKIYSFVYNKCKEVKNARNIRNIKNVRNVKKAR